MQDHKNHSCTAADVQARVPSRTTLSLIEKVEYSYIKSWSDDNAVMFTVGLCNIPGLEISTSRSVGGLAPYARKISGEAGTKKAHS